MLGDLNEICRAARRRFLGQNFVELTCPALRVSGGSWITIRASGRHGDTIKALYSLRGSQATRLTADFKRLPSRRAADEGCACSTPLFETSHCSASGMRQGRLECPHEIGCPVRLLEQNAEGKLVWKSLEVMTRRDDERDARHPQVRRYLI